MINSSPLQNLHLLSLFPILSSFSSSNEERSPFWFPFCYWILFPVAAKSFSAKTFFLVPRFRLFGRSRSKWLHKDKGYLWPNNYYNYLQYCRIAQIVAAWLRENGERMRKWRGNGGEMEREWRNGEIFTLYSVSQKKCPLASMLW